MEGHVPKPLPEPASARRFGGGVWGASPLGKFQVFPQLSRGVDVTQRVLGVDEDEALDLHTLKPSVEQDTLSSSQRQEPQGPTGWGWLPGRLPGKCDGTPFPTQHEANRGRELHLQHHVSYGRKQMQRTKPRGNYAQMAAGLPQLAELRVGLHF